MPHKDPEKRKAYHRQYDKNRTEEQKERRRKTARKWQQANPDKVRASRKKYYASHRFEEIRKATKGNQVRYQKYRLMALTHYGGDPPKCKCCGEKIFQFLVIHHPNNDGKKHRQQMRKKYSWGIYEFLKRNNYPPGFDVLCYNCNLAIAYYGSCPHQSQLS